MRPEDELVNMVRGRNPMMAPGPPEGPPGGPPADMMPPEPPPQEPMMEQPVEPELPATATVMEIQGDTVILQDETGKMRKIPISDFPIPPQEGMQMVQATVENITDGMMTVAVGPEKVPVDLPANENFAVGDLFWMPAPPSGAPEAPPMGPEELI